MAALHVPTSRSLAAVTTGDPVYRETALPGAVLARVARSHIRIGTTQFFAARQDLEALRLLVKHVIDRHYPDISKDPNPVLSLLDKVMQAQAHLVVSWQMLGFIPRRHEHRQYAAVWRNHRLRSLRLYGQI